MEHSLGTYTFDVVWLKSHVGVWRAECRRCGYSRQLAQGEPGDKTQEAMRLHVCDPAKKGASA